MLILLALLSAGLNGDVVGGINVAVKYASMIVILLAAFQALRRDPEARFLTWAMVYFLPLLVFPALSLALNLPKGPEAGRSAERRVGKEGVRTGRYRGWEYH